MKASGAVVLALVVVGGNLTLGAPDEGSTITSVVNSENKALNLTSLNVRLSQRPIDPPENLVKHKVDLPNIRAARSLVGPSPKAAILEDDQHNRVMILSALEDGRIQAQLLADLNLQPKIPFVTACAHDRECAYDRRPITGGLGCIAICVQQALDPTHQR